jgi:hypothetical protein
MGFYHFPSEFVYWTKNERHEEIKDKLMKKIEEDKINRESETFGVVNGTTNYDTNGKNDFLSDAELQESLVFEPLEKMIREFNLRYNINTLNIDKCLISSSWYTEYKINGYLGTHAHDGPTFMYGDTKFQRSFSGIYILNDLSEKNSTEFFVPSMCKTSALSHDHYVFKTEVVPEISEGSILIFPSSLYHHVNASTEPGRITISFNIDCSYKNEPVVNFSN